MKIATYNANSIRSRIELLLEWLQKNQPTVLCIQETKVQDDDFPIDAFSETGYEVIFRGQKKYNGVALFSRVPLTEIEWNLPKDPRREARFLKARAENVYIVNTYIPQGQDPDSEKFQYKLEYFRLLKSYFESTFAPADPVVWCGDFNIAREAIDVYDPKGLWGHVCYCQDVQDALETVMEWGFSDVFRLLHPEPEQYTFWDYRVPNALKRKMGWRLDYIMASKFLAQKCRQCWIDVNSRIVNKPSDHTFVTAEFAL